MKTSISALVLTLLLMVSHAEAALVGAPAVAFPAPNLTGPGGNTDGWTFTVNSPISVTALGYYDHDADGLAASHPVALWDSSANLLASAVVAPSDTLLGLFRYSEITPIVLAPGNYVIGTVTGSGDVLTGGVASFTVNPAITFGNGVFGPGGAVPSFPTLTQPGVEPSFFGPNFLSTSAVIVPEPATASLGLLGLAGLMMRRLRVA